MTHHHQNNGYRVIGLLLIALAGLSFFANHIWPRHETYSTEEILLHVVLFVVGIMFYRPAGLKTISEALARYKYGNK